MDTPVSRMASADNGRPILLGAAIAVAVGAVASMLLAVTARRGPFWSSGFQLIVYMLAALTIAGLLGLVFAVPRARTDAAEQTTERYSANSNLEQISDWLTKILVGAGLVQLATLPNSLESMGHFLGDDLGLPNGPAVAVTMVLYGAGTGFLFVYLWVRLRLRVLLESSEKQAEEQSRRDLVAASLTAAAARSTTPESPTSITRAATEATAAMMRRKPAEPVLWVDDHPENNEGLIEAFRTLGIVVDTALSTDEALYRLDRGRYGVVITDLGRSENDEEHPDAGLELIQAIRARGMDVPSFVYGGARAFNRRSDLTSAGATAVFNRATELLTAVVGAITDSDQP